MWNLHEMLIADEIVFCGLMLFAGIITGAVVRFLVGLRGRKVTP